MVGTQRGVEIYPQGAQWEGCLLKACSHYHKPIIILLTLASFIMPGLHTYASSLNRYGIHTLVALIDMDSFLYQMHNIARID